MIHRTPETSASVSRHTPAPTPAVPRRRLNWRWALARAIAAAAAAAAAAALVWGDHSWYLSAFPGGVYPAHDSFSAATFCFVHGMAGLALALPGSVIAWFYFKALWESPKWENK